MECLGPNCRDRPCVQLTSVSPPVLSRPLRGLVEAIVEQVTFLQDNVFLSPTPGLLIFAFPRLL